MRYIVQSTGKRDPLTAKKRPATVAGNNEGGRGSEERAKMVKSKKLRLLMIESPSTPPLSVEPKLSPSSKRPRRMAKSKCIICGAAFTHLDDLKWHKETIHGISNNAPLLAGSIRKSSRIQAKFKQKDEDIEGIEVVELVECDASVENDLGLGEKADGNGKNVDIEKSKGSEAILICHHCKYTCKRKNTLIQHMITRHPNKKIDVDTDLNESVLSCAICLKTFIHKTNLRKHVSSHELSNNGDKETAKSDPKMKRGYCCDICYRGFPNQRDMLAHRDVVHDTAVPLEWTCFHQSNVKVKYCHECNKYYNEKLFSDHECVKDDSEQVIKKIQELLDSTPSYKCDVCSLCFHWKWMYRSHRENVHHLITLVEEETSKSEILFYCKSCLKAFENDDQLTKHRLICVVNSEIKVGEFMCSLCCKSFTRKSDFRRHLRTKHHDPEQVYIDDVIPRKKTDITCPYCDVQMATRTSILKHIKDTHDVEMDTPFACISCNKVFKRKATMDMHNQIYHPKEEDIEQTNKIVKEAEFLLNGDLAYHCNVCNRNLPSSTKFIAHYRLHNLERKYTCDLCGKQTRTQHQLNSHIKIIHLNIRNYECDICHKTFHSKQSCEEHRRIHTGERPFSCEICGKTFIALNALFTHKKFHNDFFAHPCSMCPKKFKVRRSLINHIRTHTGERPYKCEICSKTFNNSSRFSYHKKVTHSDNRPFTCDQCGSCFKANKFLMRHMKLHSIRTHIQFRRRNNPAYFEKQDTNVKNPSHAGSNKKTTQNTKVEADLLSKSVQGFLTPATFTIRRIPCSDVENIRINSVVGDDMLDHNAKSHFLAEAFTDSLNQNKFNAECTNDSAPTESDHMVTKFCDEVGG